MASVIAIIQARMASTRLPGKVLIEIDNRPLLETMVSRVKKSKKIDKIIIATSESANDNVIIEFCKKNKYNYYVGSELDVLSRYYYCAIKNNADTIVRLTADCPLIDPYIIDKVINLYEEDGYDYASNTVPFQNSKYPDGSDVEVFSLDALKKAYREVTNDADREHVTFYFWKYNNFFRTIQLSNKENWSEFRITIDYPEDLEVIKFILKEIKNRKIFGTLEEIMLMLKENPHIANINSKYYYGIGWEKNS